MIINLSIIPWKYFHKSISKWLARSCTADARWMHGGCTTVHDRASHLEILLWKYFRGIIGITPTSYEGELLILNRKNDYEISISDFHRAFTVHDRARLYNIVFFNLSDLSSKTKPLLLGFL